MFKPLYYAKIDFRVSAAKDVDFINKMRYNIN